MINEKILVPAIFALFIVLEAITGRFLQKEKGSTRDIVIEAASSLTIVLITVPLIFAVAPLLVEAVRPGSADALAGLPWWAMLAIRRRLAPVGLSKVSATNAIGAFSIGSEPLSLSTP